MKEIMDERTFNNIEKKLDEKYILLTKKEFRRYLTIAGAVLTALGFGSYAVAWQAAKNALAENTAIIARDRIIELKAESEANAKIIAETAKAWQQGEYLQNITKIAGAVESAFSVFVMDPQLKDPQMQKSVRDHRNEQAIPAFEFFKKETGMKNK
jgi:hypothetical protein